MLTKQDLIRHAENCTPLHDPVNDHFEDVITSTDSTEELHLVVQQMAIDLEQPPIDNEDFDYFGIAVEIEDSADELSPNKQTFVRGLLIADEHQGDLLRSAEIEATS